MDEWRRHALATARAVRGQCRERGVRGGRILPPRRGPRHASIPVIPRQAGDRRKLLDMTPDVALATGQESLIVVQRGRQLVYQFSLPQQLWQPCTRADLEVRQGAAAVGMGLAEEKEEVHIDFRQAVHLAIMGSSQVSGKSTAAHSLVTGMMTNHTPEELKVLMVDPAGDCCRGLEQAEHLLMPPARNVAEAAMVIDRMLEEKREREQAQVRADSGLPMILLVIDEAQNIIPQANRQAELASLGETVGKLDIHLVIATQKPLEETLPGLMFNMSTRLVGHVPTSRDAALLTGRTSQEAPAHRLTERGEFLYINGNITRFTAARATDEDTSAVTTGEKPVEWPGLEAEWIEEETVNKGGAPTIKPTGDAVAHYLWALMRGKKISERLAHERLGLKATGHRRNRAFAEETWQTLQRLGYEKTD